MNEKEFITQLKNLRNEKMAGAPSAEFVRKNREILLMQVKNSSTRKEMVLSVKTIWRIFEAIMPENIFKFVLRPALMSILVFGVAFGGWAATVSASYDSLPGDTLYPLKTMAEKAQLTLTSTENKPSLHVEFAGKRLEEINKLAAKPSSPNNNKRAREAVKNFTKQVQAAKTALEKLDNKEPAKAIEVAQIVDQKATEYVSALEKTKEAVSENVKAEVDAAASAANSTSIKAIEVIVRKSEEGSVPIDKNEVVGRVEEKIRLVENEISSVTSTLTYSVSEAKNVLAQAKEELSSEKLSEIVDKLVEVKNLVNTVIEVAATSSPSGIESTTSIVKDEQ